jgi:hypothetical protein
LCRVWVLTRLQVSKSSSRIAEMFEWYIIEHCTSRCPSVMQVGPRCTNCFLYSKVLCKWVGLRAIELHRPEAVQGTRWKPSCLVSLSSVIPNIALNIHYFRKTKSFETFGDRSFLLVFLLIACSLMCSGYQTSSLFASKSGSKPLPFYISGASLAPDSNP